MLSDSPASTTTYHLYTFYCSSCAARIRIATNLKRIPVISHYVNMQSDEHETEDYRELNPSASIPTLVVETSNGARGEPSKFSITQSVAILEYFEEVFPDSSPLLPPPSQPEARARVRELMYIITSDIFPPTNARIAQRVRGIRNSRDDQMSFARTIFNEGFTAYEKMLERYSKGKKYSAGDEVTLADVCLVPQVQQARFYGVVDLGQWPLLSGVIGRLEDLEAFRKAGWKYQGDTPEEHRVKEEQ
ncbi:maleylacetoacetate isomerase [Trematosphaeria pertusa]|uniref:Maleylacetoacetate isomerase n=1 Tax=Trematosphaeria pertusa TaxID=390896 RepID=A0A6A6J326_9PLEO|nr:maleylacetoacetate isomerase [Trematosphaeria pertusa]KAF2256978.1 maleylacetoacetate isomerase [Trematosphaeria pertusa]